MDSAKEALCEGLVNIAFYIGAFLITAVIIREVDDLIARYKK
jgi:hypothetical protein